MELQTQKVSENSLAIQANGNVTINDYLQIKEICTDLYKLNFPTLVQEASDKAKENLKLYVDTLIMKIGKEDESTVQKNLKTPNGQYVLNESIKNSARYGQKIDLSILAESVKTALVCDDDLLNNLFSYASEIIPRLNKYQMQMILTSFYIHILSFKTENFQSVESFTQFLFRNMNNFELMTNANKQHLVSLGIFSFNQFAGGTGISFIQRKYPTFFENDIKPAFEAGKMPFLQKVLNYYDSNKIVQYVINPVGSSIGFLIAKQEFPDLSPSILINL